MRNIGNEEVTLAQFQHHLGRHMEQLALSVIQQIEFLNDGQGSDSEESDSEESDSEESDSEGDQEPLLRAVRKGDLTEVKLLLEKGDNLELKDIEGQTPLIWAVRKGHPTVVKLLLERGANLESEDIEGQTPLQWAYRNGNGTVIKLLLDNSKVKASHHDRTEHSSGSSPRRQEASEESNEVYWTWNCCACGKVVGTTRVNNQCPEVNCMHRRCSHCPIYQHIRKRKR
jgi:ankyrin repeat protein